MISPFFSFLSGNCRTLSQDGDFIQVQGAKIYLHSFYLPKIPSRIYYFLMFFPFVIPARLCHSCESRNLGG
ncbi:hypothetical protein C4544_02370 [candidate division WS5 bacterium]|uniref:Uncharacterized protein n=1 Tax=candidate division WS5 bacterium TaxID=2093353 RepID=A0A419DEI6_9BACT|nr:MAG: hypothetical protein C4544_02370 [candidate division WS5 bacterium]